MLYEFTKAETERINHLYGTDFKDITPDDAMLIGRFEANKALQSEEYQAKIDVMQQECKERSEYMKEQHEAAMRNLNYLHDRAVKRMEAVNDGK